MTSGEEPYLSTELIEHLLDRGSLRAVFQPVVDLRSGAVAGYEALVRGPEGTPLEHPRQLFAAAAVNEHVAQLDWGCRAAAFDGALRAGIHRPIILFVNAHPDALGSRCPSPFLARAAPPRELRIVVDIPEYALVDDPARILREAAGLRERGWEVAVDDLSGDPAALELLPFLDPDIVKIDLGILQPLPVGDLRRVVSAIGALNRRTGATVLAEGVATESHRAAALEMGATLGAGWLLGHPQPGPVPVERARAALAVPPRSAPIPPRSPWDARPAAVPVAAATKAELAGITQEIERSARQARGPLVVLASFQEARHFGPAAAERYRRLAADAAFAAVLGLQMPEEPAPRVRGIPIALDDPLIDQWAVAVLGPDRCELLVARDLGNVALEGDRRFEWFRSDDRDVVLGAARSMAARLSR